MYRLRTARGTAAEFVGEIARSEEILLSFVGKIALGFAFDQHVLSRRPLQSGQWTAA
jgi:hypothetical protein